MLNRVSVLFKAELFLLMMQVVLQFVAHSCRIMIGKGVGQLNELHLKIQIKKGRKGQVSWPSVSLVQT